jgi:membrane protease YdiL (CAAX protease family)
MSQTENKNHYLIILIPALLSLFIIAFEDFINNILILPLRIILNDWNLVSIPTEGDSYVLFLLLLNLLLNFSALILIYFLFFKSKLLSNQINNKQYGYFITLGSYVSLFTIVTVVGLILTFFKEIYFPELPSNSPYDNIFPQSANYSLFNLILLVLLVCIFAPILEEIIFRRILIPSLEGTQFVSTPFAVVISASMFALIHSEGDLISGSLWFTFVHFTSAFILGLGLAGVYITTRNIKFPIIYHSVNNSFALGSQIILAYFVVDLENPPDILIYYTLLFLLMLLIGLLIIILSLFNLRKIFYPFVNQFRDGFGIAKKFAILIVILITQASIFILIPILERYLFSIFEIDGYFRYGINLLVYLLIFGFFILVLNKNKDFIKKITKVQNNLLIDYNEIYYKKPTNYQYPARTELHQPNKFCTNCGYEITAQNISFCTNCGQKL